MSLMECECLLMRICLLYVARVSKEATSTTTNSIDTNSNSNLNSNDDDIIVESVHCGLDWLGLHGKSDQCQTCVPQLQRRIANQSTSGWCLDFFF